MKQRPDGLATRKLRHIDVCLTGPVDYVGVTTGFEWFDQEKQKNVMMKTRKGRCPRN